MRVDILTLFPGMFQGPFSESIVKRAIERGLLKIVIHSIRDYARDKHRVTDDYPYGGGAGMIMKPEPLFEAVEAVKETIRLQALGNSNMPVILLTPQGRPLDQNLVKELATQGNLIFVCGHYEGVDERVCQHLVTDEISIGDYVLTGGEIPAMALVDAVVRCLPGVLGSEESLKEESHSQGLLEHPHYTRPPLYRGWGVPSVLLSGNHAAIAKWRQEQSILRTAARRPDLLARAHLTEEERRLVEEHTLREGEN